MEHATCMRPSHSTDAPCSCARSPYLPAGRSSTSRATSCRIFMLHAGYNVSAPPSQRHYFQAVFFELHSDLIWDQRNSRSKIYNPSSPMTTQPSVSLLPSRLETPLGDARQYELLIMGNKLEVLLVHDATTDRASAALDIRVGSYSDPPGMPGTAHAVE